jgi:SAM-dependent methyltransferase
MTQVRELWNSNIHYHDLVIAALPREASRVLDVGCGDGVLLADLVEAGIAHVVGIDSDGAVLERARTRFQALPIEWMLGDVMSADLEPQSFDAVVSVASLHHMDAERALVRFAQLVRPGGVVVVIGLARADWWDIPADAIAIASRVGLSAIRPYWEHSAPQCWPPPLTYREMKALGAGVLPGGRYRRHLLGRYSLIWEKGRSIQ